MEQLHNQNAAYSEFLSENMYSDNLKNIFMEIQPFLLAFI